MPMEIISSLTENHFVKKRQPTKKLANPEESDTWKISLKEMVNYTD
jgi:hypothetical protein